MRLILLAAFSISLLPSVALAKIGPGANTIPLNPPAAQPTAAADEYPAEFAEAFMSGCADDPADQTTCACILQQMQNTYSFEAMQQLIAAHQQTGQLTEEVKQLARSCVGVN